MGEARRRKQAGNLPKQPEVKRGASVKTKRERSVIVGIGGSPLATTLAILAGSKNEVREGNKKMYNDPVAFARQVRMPMSLSKIWCANQLELQKQMEAARLCPKCLQYTLVLEPGSYEECTNDYVYCENYEVPAIDEDDGTEYMAECDYVTYPEKAHEPLAHWFDFDIIWAFSCGFMDKMHEFGNLQEWVRFCREEVEKIQPKVSV